VIKYSELTLSHQAAYSTLKDGLVDGVGVVKFGSEPWFEPTHQNLTKVRSKVRVQSRTEPMVRF